MKIAYVGNHRPPWATETHVALTLESLGHTVLRLQEGPHNAIGAVTAEHVLDVVKIQACDMLMWTRCWNLTGNPRAMLEGCAALGVPTVAYHLDLYAPIPRATAVPGDPWWRCKYVFSTDGDPSSEAFFASHGINHVYIPAGVYHGGCYLAAPDEAARTEVAFVGSYNYHKEWPYRPKLIDWLSKTYGSRFRLVPGPGKDACREHALNVQYASTKVTVGDSLIPNFTHTNYSSDRLFETLGRGGFLIYPRIKGITDGTLVEEGRHLACYDFGDFEGLQKTIDHYLAHDEERERIRLAGHEHVKANHTYQDRLRRVLAHVDKAEGWT